MVIIDIKCFTQCCNCLLMSLCRCILSKPEGVFDVPIATGCLNNTDPIRVRMAFTKPIWKQVELQGPIDFLRSPPPGAAECCGSRLPRLTHLDLTSCLPSNTVCIMPSYLSLVGYFSSMLSPIVAVFLSFSSLFFPLFCFSVSCFGSV